MTKNKPNTNALIDTNNFDVVSTFCIIDDFFKIVYSDIRSNKGRKSSLNPSEIATIVLIGCNYECGCLKSLYKLLWDKFRNDFKIPRYQNFVNLMNKYSLYTSSCTL